MIMKSVLLSEICILLFLKDSFSITPEFKWTALLFLECMNIIMMKWIKILPAKRGQFLRSDDILAAPKHFKGLFEG